MRELIKSFIEWPGTYFLLIVGFALWLEWRKESKWEAKERRRKQKEWENSQPRAKGKLMEKGVNEESACVNFFSNNDRNKWPSKN